MKKLIRLFLPAMLMILLAGQIHAQITVGLSIKRRLFVIYEPIVATVTVTNLAGRDITLKDSGANNWFSFQIETEDGRVVAPVNPNYSLEPLEIPAGQTIRRSVNLTELYQVHNFGLFRVRASVFWDDVNRYFSSPRENIEVTEGRTIWEKTVGVPEGVPGAGEFRTITLLKHRQPKENMLYARIVDRDNGYVLCMYPLGRILREGEPDAMLDRGNDLHVLHIVGPKTYLYSRVGVNGEWKGHTTFSSTKTRPVLRMTESGEVAVLGGRRDVPMDMKSPEVPKISDRPPGMPNP